MYLRKALTVLAFLGFAGVPVHAEEENACQTSMKARVGVIVDKTLKYGGEASVQSCKGLSIRFHAINKTFEASEVFSETGYNFFKMNLDYIAMTFIEPVPDEFVGTGWPFMYFPDPETITGDHSDLAVGLNGRADTIVFKFNEQSPVTILQFYETKGPWFQDIAYSGN